MRNLDFKPINAVDGTTNPASAAIDASQWFAFSVQAVGTGTIAGALKVQVSNDPATGGAGPSNWIDLPSATVTLSSLIGLIAKVDSAYNWVRVVFTTSGGAGNITAQIKANSF
jgi:hypothetical protein